MQEGARLHYAIPLAIQRAGMLERMYTNWYSSPGSVQRLVSRVVAAGNADRGRRMLDRYCPELDASRVTAFPTLVRHERQNGNNFPSRFAYHTHLAKLVCDGIARRGWGGADTLYGFMRHIHPDLCRAAKEAGLAVVADQIIAPCGVEEAEERLQQERFPDWTTGHGTEPVSLFAEYERETWKHLDHVTCASNYVREGLISQGIAAERISVLPYPLDFSHFPLHDRSKRSGVVTVGFVGSVGLRKGAPYFQRVAKRLAGKGIRFVMVGPVHLSEKALAEMKPVVEVVGPVPRSGVIERLREFDILLFPSTCEGSAGSVMEAMATGLPVVTTPNSGTLVEDGVSGYVAAYDDVEGLAAGVEKLASDKDLRLEMGRAARAALEVCTIDAYSRNWAAMAGRLPVVAKRTGGGVER